ncbi:MAG: Ferrous-iron efflux pump FieF [Candidatus Dichloromethanomonas elyunquensis]|nr:MAG: Ferrous-iron efflux pump FieF [Candidatus Dichloromethanomonas elyunquensis]
MDADSSKRAIFIALSVNLIIFLTKAIGAWISGSAVMYSESLHSLADMCNSVFLLIGLFLALRPPDQDHPFGYGKEVYFWSFMASIFMLGVTSAGSIYAGVQHMLSPEKIDSLFFPVIVLTISVCSEYFAVNVAANSVLKDLRVERSGIKRLTYALCNFHRVSNPVLKFVFVEDTVAFLGALLALSALIYIKATGILFFDGLVSVIIGILLGFMALLFAKQNKEMIIGQSAPDSLEQAIGDAALTVDSVADISDLKTMIVGPQDLLVNMEIEIAPATTVEKLDGILEDVERRIRDRIPFVKYLSIEVSPDDRVQEWPKAL